MIYELELEIAENKISYFEEFLKSMTFVKKLKKKVRQDDAMLAGNFISEKSAEEIIAEIKESRSFGHTRIIEPF
jgi:hypothetical protein